MANYRFISLGFFGFFLSFGGLLFGIINSDPELIVGGLIALVLGILCFALYYYSTKPPPDPKNPYRKASRRLARKPIEINSPQFSHLDDTTLTIKQRLNQLLRFTIDYSTIQQLHIELVKRAINLNLTIPENQVMINWFINQSTAFGENQLTKEDYSVTLNKFQEFLDRSI